MMNQLFEERPEQWGLRGDPYVWEALQERLRGTPVPAEAGEVEGLLLDAFRAVVGVDLTTAPEEAVYREEFAHGGMSSGSVHLPTWRERLVPLLVRRARG
ncbi:hypothetical protein [Actinomadura verrucosospora]|uniref:hypothetical protein n=1 Tax=Actinomadura verrucosospora TaxID=46165 RepID=UPI00156635DD|nr:hypothetical protein [Actinomadura verrucosospora]